MSKKFDDAQKLAMGTMENVVVSAGAGSGKTTVLAERFCRLVTERKIPVERILTLTFTRKATVEMKRRIFKQLKAYADGGSAEAQAALENFNKAQIQTLDSYCASVARQGSRFYGITPGFSTEDSAVQDRISSMALEFLLGCKERPAIKSLAAGRDFAAIADDFFVRAANFSTLAEPMNFADAVRNQMSLLPAEWKKFASEAEGAAFAIRELAEENGIAALAGGSKPPAWTVALSRLLENPVVQEPPEIPALDLHSGQDLDERIQPYISYLALFSEPDKIRSNVTKNGAAEIREQFEILYAATDRLCSIADWAYALPVIQDAAELLDSFSARVMEFKRNSGMLTFADISALALRILKEHPEIRSLEKAKFQAIMIDEFQDNNSLQRDILFMLAERPSRMEIGVPDAGELEPEKLFFVGDEKQSIYKFRGADVEVFRKLKRSFSRTVEMATNYRSSAELVAAFNSIFGGFAYPPDSSGGRHKPSVFMKEANLPDYEAEYSKVGKSEEKAPSDGYKTRAMRVALLNSASGEEDEDLLGDAESEAAWVANEIHSLIFERKEYEAGEIAILFQRTSRQDVFERALLRRGIPYSAEAVKGFFSDGPVNDLFAALCLCAYPDDRNALAKVLTSPFVGLGMEQAKALLAGGGNPIFDADFPCGELENLKWARGFFAGLLESARNAPLSQTLRRLWDETGYRYETLWNRKVEMYGSLYDMLFELARQSDAEAEGLSEFLDKVREFQDDSAKVEDIDIPYEARECVHLMTIHKSKGLEFPVVFVCGASSRPPRKRDKAAPVFLSAKYGPCINTSPCPASLAVRHKGDFKGNYFYALMERAEDARLCAELRRLTYVAFTRAEKRLYVTGSLNFSKDEPFSAAEFYEPFDLESAPAGDRHKAARNVTQVILPLLQSYVEFDGKDFKARADSPFDFEKFEAFRREEIEFEHGQKNLRRNDADSKDSLLDGLEPLYENCGRIEMDADEGAYIAPSRLCAEPKSAPPREAPFDSITRLVLESVPGYEERREELDPLADALDFEGGLDPALPKPRFSFADFGTVAHAYMESALNGQPPKIPSAALSGLDGDDAKIRAVHSACQKMRDMFASSRSGREAASSPWRRTEYKFRMNMEGRIVRGSIDLVFRKADGGLVVLDYKTGRSIEPEIYRGQMAAYRRAAALMAGVDEGQVECRLFYLRYGKEAEA